MLIIHLADIHIGRKQYGLDERALDFEKTFKKAIEKILQIHDEKEISHVIISGDLFDTSRPTPNNYITVIDCLRKLRENKIEVLVIRGNHDTSVVNPIENPLNVLHSTNLVKYLECNYIDYSKVRFIGIGCTFSDNQNKVFRILDESVDQNKLNIVLMHQYVEGTPYTYQIPNLDLYTVNEKILTKFDNYCYWALGHIHEFNIKHPKLNVHYPGSLEIWDSKEFEVYQFKEGELIKVKDQDRKGFLLLEINETSGKVNIKPIEIETSRKMIRIDVIGQDMDLTYVRRCFDYIIEHFDLPGAFIQVVIKGTLKEGLSTRDLSLQNYRRLLKKALRLSIKYEIERRSSTEKKKIIQDIYSLGINEIIKSAIREVLGKQDEKFEEFIISLIDLADKGLESKLISILEEELKVNLKPETSILRYLTS